MSEFPAIERFLQLFAKADTASRESKILLDTAKFCLLLHRLDFEERSALRAELAHLLAEFDPEVKGHELTDLDLFTRVDLQRRLGSLAKARACLMGLDERAAETLVGIIREASGNTSDRNKAIKKMTDVKKNEHLRNDKMHPTVILQILAEDLHPFMGGEKVDHLAGLHKVFRDYINSRAHNTFQPLLENCWLEEAGRLALQILDNVINRQAEFTEIEDLRTFNAKLEEFRRFIIQKPDAATLIKKLDHSWDMAESEAAKKIFASEVEAEKMFLDEGEDFDEEQMTAFKKLASDLYAACRTGSEAQQTMRSIWQTSEEYVAAILRQEG